VARGGMLIAAEFNMLEPLAQTMEEFQKKEHRHHGDVYIPIM
jgi:hypothetical protein